MGCRDSFFSSREGTVTLAEAPRSDRCGILASALRTRFRRGRAKRSQTHRNLQCSSTACRHTTTALAGYHLSPATSWQRVKAYAPQTPTGKSICEPTIGGHAKLCIPHPRRRMALLVSALPAHMDGTEAHRKKETPVPDGVSCFREWPTHSYGKAISGPVARHPGESLFPSSSSRLQFFCPGPAPAPSDAICASTPPSARTMNSSDPAPTVSSATPSTRPCSACLLGTGFMITPPILFVLGDPDLHRRHRDPRPHRRQLLARASATSFADTSRGLRIYPFVR